MSLDIGFKDGKVKTVALHDPQEILLTDCRDTPSNFVSLDISDGSHRIHVYLPVKVLNKLTARLLKLSARTD